MAKKTPSPAPAGPLNSTSIAFGIGMLVVGLVLGRLMGSGDVPAPPAPVAVKAAPTPGPKKIDGGTLKKLSEQEKKEALARKAAKPIAAPAVPNNAFTTAATLESFEDTLTKNDYTRAAAFMDKGNARSARPLLTKLHGASAGKAWREPVTLLLARAKIDLGEVAPGRALLTTWRAEFPKSSLEPHAVVAEGRAYMQEGKRIGAPGAPPDDAKKASYASAIERFDDASSRWPTDLAVADALFNKAAMLGELKDVAGAEKAALELTTRFPGARVAPRALYNAAKAAEASKDGDAAERLYQRLLDDYPKERLARSARSQLQALALLGKPAPPIGYTEVIGEAPGTIESYDGKVVVLVFWATWCPHCRKEMPKLEEQWARWQKDGVQVIAVTRHSKGQTTESVQTYATENGLSYPIIVDPGDISRAYNVSGIPAAAIVGKDGTVVFRNHPAQITDALIAKLVNG
jgi:peroxiredoxin/outer membrane protein assembly factor BamD (BamD/ComL family)